MTLKCLKNIMIPAMLGSIREKLSKTRQAFMRTFEEILLSDKPREEILDDLAEGLIAADVGVAQTEKILESIRQKTLKSNTFSAVKKALREELLRLLSLYPIASSLDSSRSVIMMVGINGGGKTTSLAKLAFSFKKEGKKVMAVAADTFRAAAPEQLVLWGKRLDFPVIRGSQGADPASVVFDAVRSFKTHLFDILLVDTAGRIHTKTNLMNELEKIRRIISREIEGAPHEVLLVLDASIGQNSLSQAREFLKFSGITGIFLAKLDGTARGGSVVSIVDELRIPVKFIGTGEGEEDILPFSPQLFVDALFS